MFQEYKQAVVLVAEPVSNTILLSASPEWFPRQVMRMIEAARSRMPLQVAVKCLIAEVDLSNSEEFGVQFGLQSPILFTPAPRQHHRQRRPVDYHRQPGSARRVGDPGDRLDLHTGFQLH